MIMTIYGNASVFHGVYQCRLLVSSQDQIRKCHPRIIIPAGFWRGRRGMDATRLASTSRQFKPNPMLSQVG